MKIFILAFCIFQISLAQTPADRINDDFKAALAASQKLAEQVKFVIDKNGQLPEVVIGPAIRYFYFLSGLLLELKRIPKYAELANAVEEFINAAKSVSDGLKNAGITLETIAAFVSFNLYSNVMNNLNAKANLNSEFTTNLFPRISLPADFKAPKISSEILIQLNDDFGKLYGAVSNLGKYKDLFVNNFDSFGQSILYYIDRFGVDTVDGLAKMIDPKVSEMIKNSVGTLKTHLVDVATYLVHKGTPLGEVMWDITINGAYSIFASYGQLINPGSP